MLYVLAVGVAGGAIGGFFAHAFLADEVADSIGWPAGSPFQLEVAFANLALGILAILAMNRRDGFRDATVIAVAIFAGGATITHVKDIVETGNLAAGNTVQNVDNLVTPALLIWLLLALRRSASPTDMPTNPRSLDRGGTPPRSRPLRRQPWSRWPSASATPSISPRWGPPSAPCSRRPPRHTPCRAQLGAAGDGLSQRERSRAAPPVSAPSSGPASGRSASSSKGRATRPRGWPQWQAASTLCPRRWPTARISSSTTR